MTSLTLANVYSLAEAREKREARQEAAAWALLYADSQRWMDQAPRDPEPPRAA